MPIYNLLEYSDNYEESSGSLRQFQGDEQNVNNDGNLDDVTTNGSTSFKYKSSLQIVVTLKHLSNFFSSLEMPLIIAKFI